MGELELLSLRAIDHKLNRIGSMLKAVQLQARSSPGLGVPGTVAGRLWTLLSELTAADLFLTQYLETSGESLTLQCDRSSPPSSGADGSMISGIGSCLVDGFDEAKFQKLLLDPDETD